MSQQVVVLLQRSVSPAAKTAAAEVISSADAATAQISIEAAGTEIELRGVVKFYGGRSRILGWFRIRRTA